MTQSDKLYRFWSRSQHILTVSKQGRKCKVKFSTPYDGLARYSTSDEHIARQIRKSVPYLNGMIKEEEPISNKVYTQPETTSFVKKEQQKPTWMQRGVKLNKPLAAEAAKPADDNVNKQRVPQTPTPVTIAGNTEEGFEPEAGEVNTKTEPTTEPTTESTSGNVVQGDMFGIKLEDVETYMEAKDYVRNVLGADVTRKEEVKEYCSQHGIVFPKFSFE